MAEKGHDVTDKTPAILVLADGRTFRGYGFGATGTTLGEAVFTTAMTGYQEILTERARTGRNGARWQIDTVTSLELRGGTREQALAEMTRLYRAAVDSGEPVHAW